MISSIIKLKVSNFVLQILENDAMKFEFTKKDGEPNINKLLNKLIPNLVYYKKMRREEMRDILADRIAAANIPSMVVTMGGDGAVYANLDGEKGVCPARKVQVKDTTGAGDSFCAGVAIGITYGKTLAEAVEIGTTLAASVITSSENVCPRFRPEEFGLCL